MEPANEPGQLEPRRTNEDERDAGGRSLEQIRRQAKGERRSDEELAIAAGQPGRTYWAGDVAGERGDRGKGDRGLQPA